MKSNIVLRRLEKKLCLSESAIRFTIAESAEYSAITMKFSSDYYFIIKNFLLNLRIKHNTHDHEDHIQVLFTTNNVFRRPILYIHLFCSNIQNLQYAELSQPATFEHCYWGS